jgi:4-carboxymuconolactone decarboxylase
LARCVLAPDDARRRAHAPEPSNDSVGAKKVTAPAIAAATLTALDDETRRLVRLAAIVTTAGERDMRAALNDAVGHVRPLWVEELLLQTYLFAGFPRALNSMREWRRVSAREPVPESHLGASDGELISAWRQAGERTCARVYGASYAQLRANIRKLHPNLDDWMIIEGYGKVLSRPGLDLARRELCIVAACAAAEQDRQLHSHLRGALNVGVSEQAVNDTIDALTPLLSAERMTSVRLLWARVKGK